MDLNEQNKIDILCELFWILRNSMEDLAARVGILIDYHEERLNAFCQVLRHERDCASHSGQGDRASAYEALYSAARQGSFGGRAADELRNLLHELRSRWEHRAEDLRGLKDLPSSP